MTHFHSAYSFCNAYAPAGYYAFYFFGVACGRGCV